MSVPEDLLCGLLVPDCRVLLMSRTCVRMREALQRGRCAVDIRVSNKVSYDTRLARLVPTGINNLQLNFNIRRFECRALMRFCQLKFSEFEELTFLHLRTLRMHSNALSEVQLLSLLYMLTFSGDLRTFEFTEQSLKGRHILCLADSISCFGRLETLNLDKNYFIFDSLGVVLDAVQTSTLATLNLSTNSCEDASKTLKLSRVVRTNFSTLTTLTLSFMRLCPAGLDVLLAAISECSLLESLDLSKNHLHYGCLTCVLNATAGCPRLQRFSWAGNRLGAAGTVVLANHIMQSEAVRTTWRELSLGMCDVYNGLQYLAEALATCLRLRTLDISNNAVHSHEVAKLITNTRIASLDISSNYISDYGMRLILERAMYSPTLKDLHVLGNHMGRGVIRQLRHLKKVKSVTVRIPRKSCPCNTCRSA
jgi:Leucine-rich repeat (LRR) protein